MNKLISKDMDKSLCGCFHTVYKDMYNGVEQREPQTDNNGQMMYSHYQMKKAITLTDKKVNFFL